MLLSNIIFVRYVFTFEYVCAILALDIGVILMNKLDILPNFQRGILPLVILSLLKQTDMYGYQLVQEIMRQSGEAISTQEGSLYPVLYKLVDNNYISDRRVLVGKRMTRVYYHLEPAGEAYLNRMLQEYTVICQGVMNIITQGMCIKYEKATQSNDILYQGAEATALPPQSEGQSTENFLRPGTAMASTVST